MNGDDPRDALDRLVRRVEELEAREQIARLISGYGPAVDAGAATTTAEFWAESGRYSYSFGAGAAELTGRDEIAAMVDGDHHQTIIAGGAGHVLTAPVIRVEGEEGWLVEARANRLLDGREEARQLLRT